MPSIVILGTGGTIAGTAASPADTLGYRAAQLGVAELVAAVPGLTALALETEQVAQLDSKDMDAATWQVLARRVAAHLARPEVQGLVLTHGSDTLEETAYFLHRVLAPAKPVVLTAAMRPATALGADGPQNLLDAVHVARQPGARGVLAVLAGQVWGAEGLRKRHATRAEAFGGDEGGPLALIEAKVVAGSAGGAEPAATLRQFRPWPEGQALGLDHIAADPADWPWVAVLASHADARPQAVRALLAAGVQGLVIAATGNGTVHAALQPALDEARAAGVPVWLCTRCAQGTLQGPAAMGQPAAQLTPWQARVALVLALLDGPLP